MLHAEVLAQDADIMCLQVNSFGLSLFNNSINFESFQEVDSLDKLLPTLEAAHYNHHYVAGPGICPLSSHLSTIPMLS